MTKRPHPEDWDITVAELAMILEPIGHGGHKRLSALMNRYFIDQQTASYWISLVRKFNEERDRQVSA